MIASLNAIPHILILSNANLFISSLVNPYEQSPELKVEFCDLCRLSERRGLNADAFTAENVKQELAGSVVLVDGLAFFLALDVLQVLIEEVGAVHWATLGLRVELGEEDGAGLVHHTLVAPIIEIYLSINRSVSSPIFKFWAYWLTKYSLKSLGRVAEFTL